MINEKPLYGGFSALTIRSICSLSSKPVKLAVDVDSKHLPQWTSDSSKILYVDDESGALLVIRNDGSERITLTDTDTKTEYPVWSPDGLKIAYKTHNIVYIRESGSGELIEIKVPDGGIIDTPPYWAPDSKKLVFIGYPKFFTNKTELYVFDYEERQVYNLTNTENAEEFYPAWSPIAY